MPMVTNTIIIPSKEMVIEVALNKFKRDLLNFLPQKNFIIKIKPINDYNYSI